MNHTQNGLRKPKPGEQIEDPADGVFTIESVELQSGGWIAWAVQDDDTVMFEESETNWCGDRWKVNLITVNFN